MADQLQTNEAATEAIRPAPGADGPQSPSEPVKDAAAEPKPLTPAEQMALYEEKLKEEDWGHQPC
jgi:hypothetical protein